MRGEMSNGMCCSAAEIGLGSDHDGNMILPPEATLGAALMSQLGLEGDVMYDLEINPNRPDAMSVAGVARDLAARLGIPFSIPSTEPGWSVEESDEDVHSAASVEIVDPDLCGRALLVSDVDGRGGILADLERDQAYRLGAHAVAGFAQAFTHALGDLAAVEELGGHLAGSPVGDLAQRLTEEPPAPNARALGAPTAELGTYVQAARDARLARDAPLTEGGQAVLDRMLPALARVLAVAPPRLSAREVEALCLEEWVRECCDELLRQSPVLSELAARGALHIERGAFTSGGALSLL